MRSRSFVPLLAVPVALAVPTALALSASASPRPPASSESAAGAQSTTTLQRVIDREAAACSQSSRMIGKLERDGKRLEVDAEIFGKAQEAWVIKVRQNGSLVHTIKRTADRDGELDVWRYLPNTSGIDRVNVKARSASGERCVVKLRG